MRNILFYASDYDYEEGWSTVIWEQNGNYFVKTTGHSVMIGNYEEKRKVTSDEALEIMLENAEYEDTDYLNICSCGD